MPSQPDINDVIWKYFSLPTFLAFLQGESLHFTNVKYLEDKFEFKAKVNKPERYKTYQIEETEEETEERLFVNCWSENTDSYALWQIYSGGKYGLAIQSTKQKLQDIVYKADPVTNFVINGTIKHEKVSYNNEPRQDRLQRVFTKISSYEYEGEYRICIYAPRNPFTFEVSSFDIPVDIKDLIDKIYISPFAEDYFVMAMESILKKYLGNEYVEQRLDKSIIRT